MSTVKFYPPETWKSENAQKVNICSIANDIFAEFVVTTCFVFLITVPVDSFLLVNVNSD